MAEPPRTLTGFLHHERERSLREPARVGAGPPARRPGARLRGATGLHRDQPAALVTSSTSFASTSAVIAVTAYAVGHITPSSRAATSLKPTSA